MRIWVSLLVAVGLGATFFPTRSWSEAPMTQEASPADGTEVIELAEDLEVRSLQEDLWLVWSTAVWNGQTIAANGLLLVSERGVLLVDTPWTDSQTSRLLDWIESELEVSVLHVVVTHAHNDRIGGIAAVHERGIPTFGYQGTMDLATDQGYQPPEITFSNRLDIDLGVEEVTLLYPGAGHAPDNSVVWLADRELLYGGCLIKSLASRSLGFVGDADLEAWPEALTRLQQLLPPPAVVIPGHGDIGGPELVEHTRRLLESRRSQETESN